MKRNSRTAGAVVVLVLLLPLAIYLWQFGWRVSNDHTRWGEFGSAMSGIYAPALTLATLAVLVMQVRLQAEMHRHDRDQAYVQQASADIEFYAQRLDATLLGKVAFGNTARDVLLGQFQPPSVADLDSEHSRTTAMELDKAFPQVLGSMYAIQAIFAGLSASQDAPYRLTLSSATSKLTAVLGFETCVALEHYHRARTENRLKSKYYFSPLLSPL